MDTRIDHITGGIYRISTFIPDFRISQNQFLIDDEAPTLIHTGEYGLYDNIRAAIAKVLDPKRLANLALLHWEGDENGGMDRFSARSPSVPAGRLNALHQPQRPRLRRYGPCPRRTGRRYA